MPRTGVVLLKLVCAFVILAAGCHRWSPDAKGTSVRGAVHFQGQPLSGGRITFTPDPERGGSGKPVSADLGADGRYRIGGDAVELAAGWYRLAIAAGPTAPSGFPRGLARPDQSGLLREVRPGQENVFDFAIETQVGQ